MTTFDNRDKAFENKFAHDAELEFKIIARRNKMLGQWAAEKLGLTGAEADEYAKQVVMTDFEEVGDEDVQRKVHDDLSAAGIEISYDAVRGEMNRLLTNARTEVMKE